MSDARRGALRLSKDVRRQLLEQNEGFTAQTHYEDKNFREDRTYTILDGEVHIDSKSNTSWADSRQRSEHIADQAETHRFLYNNLHSLDQDGVTSRASRSKDKVTPVADGADSDASGRYGADANDDTDDYAADDEQRKDKDGLNPDLVIAITVVLLALTIAGVAVWKKTAKPALERRRATRADQNTADERAQIEDDEAPRSLPGDEG